MYLLLLDAESAYDRVIIEHAIRCAYLAGTQDEGLIYLDKRLRSRETFIEWDKDILGPIKDTMGMEQGGCASDRLYRIVNNEQLITAQKSELGVYLGMSVTPQGDLVKLVLSAAGQADDVGLLSTSMRQYSCHACIQYLLLCIAFLKVMVLEGKEFMSAVWPSTPLDLAS